MIFVELDGHDHMTDIMSDEIKKRRTWTQWSITDKTRTLMQTCNVELKKKKCWNIQDDSREIKAVYNVYLLRFTDLGGQLRSLSNNKDSWWDRFSTMRLMRFSLVPLLIYCFIIAVHGFTYKNTSQDLPSNILVTSPEVYFNIKQAFRLVPPYKDLNLHNPLNFVLQSPFVQIPGVTSSYNALVAMDVLRLVSSLLNIEYTLLRIDWLIKTNYPIH